MITTADLNFCSYEMKSTCTDKEFSFFFMCPATKMALFGLELENVILIYLQEELSGTAMTCLLQL